MENILITLYEQGKITEDEIKEFIDWHSEIVHCAVCNKKLMHDDEAYDDEEGLGALCDEHSYFNEHSSNYHAPNAKEINDERDVLKAQIIGAKNFQMGKRVKEFETQLHYLNKFYNIKLKQEFKVKNRIIK